MEQNNNVSNIIKEYYSIIVLKELQEKQNTKQSLWDKITSQFNFECLFNNDDNDNNNDIGLLTDPITGFDYYY